MKILGHYYITLQRVPERRLVWYGTQEAHDFEFDKLTVCYAVDRMKYKTFHSICRVMQGAGLAYAKDGLAIPDIEYRKEGFKAYHASFMITFDRIRRETEEGWYLVWEGDCALNIPYPGLKHVCETAPSDAEILLLSGPPGSKKQQIVKYLNREIAKDSFFYKGCPGSGCAKLTAVTPSGARQILDIDERIFPQGGNYDTIVEHHGEELIGLYTSFVPLTRITFSTGLMSTLHCDSDEFPDGIQRRCIEKEILYLDNLKS